MFTKFIYLFLDEFTRCELLKFLLMLFTRTIKILIARSSNVNMFVTSSNQVEETVIFTKATPN